MRWAIVAVLLLGGCASRPAPPPVQAPASQPTPPVQSPVPAPSKQDLPHYRCDNDMQFDVRYGDGSAELVFASRESETLLRDAGGLTPQQTVYSSTALKAVFGLDPDGRGAKLSFASPPVEARCVRD